MNRFESVIADIDNENAQDPNLNSEGQPEGLVYGVRMSAQLDEFLPEASEYLKIAARAQHLRRWEIPREAYPLDRKGYLTWRTELKRFHAKLAGKLMERNGYSELEVQQVGNLILKKNLKTNADSQTLEDVVCLVFLTYYLGDFVNKHAGEREKILSILQKTWTKMSEKAHQKALAIAFEPKIRALIADALGA
jgi:hypothetical protein